MANAAALIKESIWRDRDFRALPRVVQTTYLQLCSQKDLDCAGLLTLNVGVLTKGCLELSRDDVVSDLNALESARFVFVDEDTDELFIRGYMRAAAVTKSPNIFKSALKSAGMVESPKLRREVAVELRRLHRVEADKLADLLDPSGTPRPDPTKGSGTLPKSGTLSKPSSTGLVTGLGICSVGNSVGEEPSQFCEDHPGGTDAKCFACGQARRQYPALKAAHDDAVGRQRSETRQAAITACGQCDDDGWRFDDRAVKCQHQEVSNA